VLYYYISQSLVQGAWNTPTPLGALSSLAAMAELGDTTVEPTCLDLAASRNIVQAFISQSASRILGGAVLHRSSHRGAVLLAVEQTLH